MSTHNSPPTAQVAEASIVSAFPNVAGLVPGREELTLYVKMNISLRETR
jgi:hypothetical protein